MYNYYQTNGLVRGGWLLNAVPNGIFKGESVPWAYLNEDVSGDDAGFSQEDKIPKRLQLHDHISMQMLADDLVEAVKRC